MYVVDQSRYRRQSLGTHIGYNGDGFLAAMSTLLLGGAGATAWAIRGSDGWDGIEGTIVPGMTWGLLWHYLCWCRGIDARGVVLWLGLGVAVGGCLGYGQYVSWIQGKFQVPGGTIHIDPWYGYAWFVVCGVGWAGPGGVMLGWAVSRRTSVADWALRLALLVALTTLCTDLVVDLFGRVFLHLCPGLLFPHHELGIYSVKNATETLDPNQQRTIYTNTQNFCFLCWWMLALSVAVARKDRSTSTLGLMLGLGFGVGFALSACWCLGYEDVHSRLDYWKVWELTAGFILGAVYSAALHWAQCRAGEQSGRRDALLPSAPRASSDDTYQDERRRSACSVPMVCVIVFFAYADGNPLGMQTGVFLAICYIAVLGYSSRGVSYVQTAHSRANGSLVFSVFLLIFVLLRGGSTRIGLVLGLYNSAAADQYAWPPQRRWLFGPTALVLVASACVSLRRGTGPAADTVTTASVRLSGARGNSPLILSLLSCTS